MKAELQSKEIQLKAVTAQLGDMHNRVSPYLSPWYYCVGCRLIFCLIFVCLLVWYADGDC